MGPSHIAILGGGLAGLSSAFHLSRRFPRSLITLLDQDSRLGGWVRSERVEVQGASVVLEAGPRTLRPNAKSILELINLLGLHDSVITTSKAAPAAKNRFLHVPGTPGLVALPSNIFGVLNSPLRSTLVPAVLREAFRPRNRPAGISDESFDAFLTRRFGEHFARILGSAVVHGIYAADSRKLSVNAAFPSLWEAEERGRGSVVRGFLTPSKKKLDKDDYDLGEMGALMNDVSVYSFRNGMNTVTDALEKYLKGQPNVRLSPNTPVKSIRYSLEKEFTLSTTSGELKPTHVVSALPLPLLQSLLPFPPPLPHLAANPSSSVTVINFVFPFSPRHPLHPAGFGYLIPRPAHDYNPHNSGILGTVFDSCALSPQDTDAHERLTKLTVMMGGPHPITPAHTAIPTVLRHLATHLSPSSDFALLEPLYYRVHHQKDCIPTPTVGHPSRVKQLRSMLETHPWDGRLEIVGASVDGVSVGDCIEAGKRVGKAWNSK